MTGAKESDVPFLTINEDDTLADTKSFQAMVGSLFIARMWRPDIRYTVNRLCMKPPNQISPMCVEGPG